MCSASVVAVAAMYAICIAVYVIAAKADSSGLAMFFLASFLLCLGTGTYLTVCFQ
jgi:tryptophan-rich sensory protein